ncbi:MAG: glycoside hydrolase [Planctomycetota bacterium]
MTSDPSKAFPYTVTEQTKHRDLSAAMRRSFYHYPNERPEENPLFTNFKYTPLEGLDYHGGDGTITRRDPSKILFESGKYYVWYTRRQTETPCLGMAGAKDATDTVASADWDLAEVWYATSDDGFVWEEQGVAVPRPPKPEVGWRSVCTPDILKWKGRFYLYYQAFLEPSGLRGDYCPIAVSHADSPDGPWTPEPGTIIPTGEEGEWDQFAVHGPCMLVHDDQIYCYYKSAFNRPNRLWVAMGLAISDDPLKTFQKHPLNPVLNSGHETALFPFKGGVAALLIQDGNEHYTVQYAEDWVNFEIASIVELAPTAAKFFDPDAFADSGDGPGVSWGLCHFINAGTADAPYSILARFDCDLRRQPVDSVLKSTKYLHHPDVYFAHSLTPEQRARIEAESTAYLEARALASGAKP